VVFYKPRRVPQTRYQKPSQLRIALSTLVLPFLKKPNFHTAKMPVLRECQKLLGRFSADRAKNPSAATPPSSIGTEDDIGFGNIVYSYNFSRPVGLTDHTLVKVFVGPERTVFFLHKELLCYHSPFFRAALTCGLKETHEGTVSLPKDEPKVFAKFVQWLYTQKLETKFIFKKNTKVSVSTTDLETITTFVQLWVFADKQGIPALQRVAVHAVRNFFETFLYLPTNVVLHIFENTVPWAEFGQLCVDLVGYMMTKRDKRLNFSKNPFLRSISRAGLVFDPPKRAWHCQTWLHGKDTICCSMMSSELRCTLNAHCRSRRPNWSPDRLGWLAFPPDLGIPCRGACGSYKGLLPDPLGTPESLYPSAI